MYYKSLYPLALPERFDNETVTAAKGLLILLVILGHASNFWTPEPYLTFSIKYYHVACFLLFPFIYDIRPISINYLKDIFARYYVPFALFLLGYAVLYYGYAKPDIQSWIKAIGEALLFGNQPMLDAAAGLRALWFLPVLTSIVLVNSIFIGRLNTPIWILLLFSWIAHITIGLLPEPYKFYLPLGFANVLYLMVIGLAIRLLCISKSKEYLNRNSHMFLFILLASLFFSDYFQTLIKFPVIALPNITDLQSVIIHDIIIISAFLFLITTPWLKKLKFFLWCGEHSLTIYLTHIVFLAAGHTLANKFYPATDVSFPTFFIVLAIFIFSLGGASFCVYILEKLPSLKSLLMPKSWSEWYPITLIKKKP